MSNQYPVYSRRVASSLRPAPGKSVERDELTDRILDAALVKILDVGLEKLSMDGLAEQLCIDPKAVAARFQDPEALERAVLLRETRRYLDGVRDGIIGDTVRARVTEGFVGGVIHRGRQHVLQILFEREPAVAMTLVVGAKAGRLLEYAIGVVCSVLRQAPDCADYTSASLDAVAIAMIRVSHSLSNAPPDHELDEHYLRCIAHDVLLPILQPANSTPSVR